MKTFAQALLVTPELWSSTCWQERTSLARPPWEAPLEFMDGTPTMTEQVAAEIRSLVEALASPDTLLGSHAKARNKRGPTKQRQDVIYYMKQFKEARFSWQKWVRKFSPSWKFLADIDSWAMTRGVDFDSLIVMSGSRQVSVLLVGHYLDESDSGDS